MRTFDTRPLFGRSSKKGASMTHLDEKIRKFTKVNGIVKLSALEVKERFFELLDKLISGELQKVEIELNGEVVAEMVHISK